MYLQTSPFPLCSCFSGEKFSENHPVECDSILSIKYECETPDEHTHAHTHMPTQLTHCSCSSQHHPVSHVVHTGKCGQQASQEDGLGLLTGSSSSCNTLSGNRVADEATRTEAVAATEETHLDCSVSEHCPGREPHSVSEHCQVGEPHSVSKHCQGRETHRVSEHCPGRKPHSVSEHCQVREPHSLSEHCQGGETNTQCV